MTLIKKWFIHYAYSDISLGGRISITSITTINYVKRCMSERGFSHPIVPDLQHLINTWSRWYDVKRGLSWLLIKWTLLHFLYLFHFNITFFLDVKLTVDALLLTLFKCLFTQREFGAHEPLLKRDISTIFFIWQGWDLWMSWKTQFQENVKIWGSWHSNIWTLPQDLHTLPHDSSLSAYSLQSHFTLTCRTNTLPTLRLTHKTHSSGPPSFWIVDDHKFYHPVCCHSFFTST